MPDTAAAEAPRQPSPEQRRKIRDALDGHYLEDKGCYAKNFSDKAVAALLDVPVKWVSDLREANGLGPDANEAAGLRADAIAALEKRLDEEETRWLATLDDLRGQLNRLKVEHSYAGAA